MGVKAYNRGSKLIRDSIAAESVEKKGWTLAGNTLQENTDLKSRITELEEQLKRAELFIGLRTAERDVEREEKEKALNSAAYYSDRFHFTDKRWKKCSAILNTIKLYVGREQFESWYADAKHDHAELWSE